jgi:hypothetical protein
LPLPSGLWSLQGLIPGMYALDVTADMSSSGILGTYETYLVVLEPGQQPLPPTTVISQITIEYTEDCPGNTTLVNGTCVEPLARCPVNSTLVNVTCVNPSPPTPPIICPADGTSTNQTCPIAFLSSWIREKCLRDLCTHSQPGPERRRQRWNRDRDRTRNRTKECL